MTEDLIRKFVDNRCTAAELNEVIHWLNTEAHDIEGRNLVLKDWESFQGTEDLAYDERFSLLFDKIQHQIAGKNQKIKENRRTLFLTWITRAAAILLLPVLFLYMNSHFENGSARYANLAADSLEIVAPIGSRTVVQLSDGSRVHLNHGSRIKYPQIFYGNKREILLNGEAYFYVAHNPEKPFIVKTGKLNIRALGTEFNIKAYLDNDIVVTTLVNGKVDIEEVLSQKTIEKVASMVPSEQTTYHLITGEIEACMVNTDKYTSWKEGKLVFDNESITTVAETLERMFNVDIEVADNLKYLTYTVTFCNDPLFYILDLMTETTPIIYKVLPRKRQSDNTFTKQKIIIEKRK